MNSSAISPRSVRRALSAIRHAHAVVRLDASPLLGLAVVGARLRAAGVVDTAENRMWMLQSILHEIVWDHLARLRGAAATAEQDSVTREQELAQLCDDCATGDIDRQAWGLLYIRFLALNHFPMGDVARIVGLGHSTVARRLEMGITGVTNALRKLEYDAQLRADQAALPVAERILVDESAAASSPAPAVMAELAETLRGEEQVIRLSAGDLASVSAVDKNSLREYRLGRVAEASRPRYRLDERFVALTLLLDQGEDAAQGRWQAAEARFDSLSLLLETVPDPVLVLLGPPGCGKTTLLRRLELELAIAGLRGDSSSVPFFVQLNEYKPAQPGLPTLDPRGWLSARWAARYPRLPRLDTIASEGRLVLLLDALNEMPGAGPAEMATAILAWKDFAQWLVSQHPGNRAVFSCRSLDYSQPLSTPTLRVPQVRVEPLSDAQIEALLHRYIPQRAEAIWAALAGSAQLDVLRSPYFLKLMVEQVAATGELPNGRAAMFTGFVRHSLRREIERGNPLFVPDSLLVLRDLGQITRNRTWRSPWSLPERGVLVPTLSQLAYAMQEYYGQGQAFQVRVDYDEAMAMLPNEHGTRVVQAGLALSVLDDDTERDEILFSHQLLQEYFAARQLARAPCPELVEAEWRAAKVSPSLSEILDSLGPADPLQPLPGTGWEETMALAAEMADEAEAFVRGVMAPNLALAGRCAAQPAVRDRLSPPFVDELRWSLVERSRDPAADLRHRIAAGNVLGELGDPRFERRMGQGCAYLLPPLVRIADGDYPIGEDEAIDLGSGPPQTAHMPAHTVPLASFALGRFPVTNAEWACFMAAGGYDDLRWWDTAASRSWQDGSGTAAGAHEDVRGWREIFKAQPEMIEDAYRHGTYGPEIYERWKARVAMTDAEFEAHLKELHPGGRLREPRYWREDRCNRPNQPVVGISWFEARAYCQWLSHLTGSAYRLPTEVEWEAAARGLSARRFAWGDEFDRLRANTFAARVKRTTPIGVFPDGDSPEGLCDLTGNVYEWTSSAYRRGVRGEEFGYPYHREDGREDPSDYAYRVVRGGGWNFGPPFARTAFRGYYLPDIRFDDVGMRLACDGTGTTETIRQP